MRYFRKTLNFDTGHDCVVTLGKFDGLHRGHMLLINRMLEIHKQDGLETVIFTFDVPPQSKVEHRAPRQLLTNAERRRELERLGIHHLVECPFVDDVMHMEPEAFIRDVLVGQIHARKVVVGTDFRFGYRRAGSAALLEKLGPGYGYETEIIEKAMEDSREISSTWVKEELIRGDMEKVSLLLGRPFTVYGEIVHGHALGRTMGIPTINQIPPDEKLLPPFGVYAAKAAIGGKQYYGITNIGVKPTVRERFVGVETFLFDCNEDLYGKMAEVSVMKYVRPEKKFSSLEELHRQLLQDAETGKRYFEKHK